MKEVVDRNCAQEVICATVLIDLRLAMLVYQSCLFTYIEIMFVQNKIHSTFPLVIICRSVLAVGYFCKCTALFVGSHCEVSISPCSSNPCLYGGTCVPRGDDFYCQCRGQYSGQW